MSQFLGAVPLDNKRFERFTARIAVACDVIGQLDRNLHELRLALFKGSWHYRTQYDAFIYTEPEA